MTKATLIRVCVDERKQIIEMLQAYQDNHDSLPRVAVVTPRLEFYAKLASRVHELYEDVDRTTRFRLENFSRGNWRYDQLQRKLQELMKDTVRFEMNVTHFNNTPKYYLPLTGLLFNALREMEGKMNGEIAA